MLWTCKTNPIIRTYKHGVCVVEYVVHTDIIFDPIAIALAHLNPSTIDIEYIYIYIYISFMLNCMISNLYNFDNVPIHTYVPPCLNPYRSPLCPSLSVPPCPHPDFASPLVTIPIDPPVFPSPPVPALSPSIRTYRSTLVPIPDNHPLSPSIPHCPKSLSHCPHTYISVHIVRIPNSTYPIIIPRT